MPQTVMRMAAQKSGPLRDFTAALCRDGFNIIAELKKASPSAGLLRPDFDAKTLAAQYEQGGAAALSVLTEQEFFQGTLADLRDARATVSLPVLRKDFIVDPWQVWETRAANADCFLLIVAALQQSELQSLIALGREVGIEPLVEVHTADELTRATDAGACIIGVNNRDLHTLEVRVETSFKLIESIPDDCVAISESGLRTFDDLRKLRAAGYDGFLVGERFMRDQDPGESLQGLLQGSE